MSNHLVSESSPYLLQHANNPVDWYPWSEEALARARIEKKPIFLSIGYSACHWCHVMERESFEDPAIAKILNRDFISIKVDREEHPDLDQIYMSAVVAMTGQGGWPLTAFLTPERQPFFGGTYFPPVPRYRMPSFSEVLIQISHLWKHEPLEILNSATKITAYLKNQNRVSRSNPNELDEVDFDSILQEIERTYDWKNGGWGAAPKFPQPMTIEFLLMLSETGESKALEIATHALGKMQQGGLFDLVGGGFHRYATDPFWLVPHFEKMLYDNSQLAMVYLHAFLRTNNQSFRKTCEATLDFILREMTGEQGGFFSSIDADSEGQEGKYYLWTYSKFEELLGSHPHKASFFRRHGITPDGNFDGLMILKKSEDDPVEEEDDDAVYLILRNNRQKRIRPTTDDKVILSWNALTIQALAEAGRYLSHPGYLKAAQLCANFILDRLCANNHLIRTWRAGISGHPAVLEDYASLVIALVSLYQADFDSTWLVKASEIASVMVALFTDSDGNFFDTQAGQSNILYRPSDVQDNATPSGTSLAVKAILSLSAMANNQHFTKIAQQNLSRITLIAPRYPLGYAYGLQNMLQYLTPFQQIGLLYPPGAIGYPEFIQVVNRRYTALRVFACSSFPPTPSHPEFIQGHPLDQNKTTLFICKNFTCLSPIQDLAQADFALSD